MGTLGVRAEPENRTSGHAARGAGRALGRGRAPPTHGPLAHLRHRRNSLGWISTFVSGAISRWPSCSTCDAPRFRTFRSEPRTRRPFCGRLRVRPVAQTPPTGGGSPHVQHQAARVHHPPRRRGGGVAARGARAGCSNAARLIDAILPTAGLSWPDVSLLKLC
jgi:hypothetical protein